jgi:hypothetical protein
MNIQQSKHTNRREFIKTCLRFGIGGGLIFTGAAIGLRKNEGNGETDLCQRRSPCRGCSQYSGCNLPKALTVKETDGNRGGRHVRK